MCCVYFDVVVIGAGAAGLTTTGGCARVGFTRRWTIIAAAWWGEPTDNGIFGAIIVKRKLLRAALGRRWSSGTGWAASA